MRSMTNEVHDKTRQRKMGKRKNEIKKQEMDKREMKEKRKSVAILAQAS